MATIVLLTQAADVQASVLETQSYLRHPIHQVESIVEAKALAPDLILWHPAEPNDNDAQQLVMFCPHIILIYPARPEGQRRMGGSYQYPPPWNVLLPSLPEQTFRALMPIDPESIAELIIDMLGGLIAPS